MRPDDERARIRESERGKQAATILESPLWDEAYQSLVNYHMSRMLADGCSDDETIECKRRILSVHAVKQAMVEIMETGQMAAQQLEARDGSDSD